MFLENIPSSTIEVFVFELYSPYSDVLKNYAKYEEEQLKNALDAIQLVCIYCLKSCIYLMIDIVSSLETVLWEQLKISIALR